MFVTLRSRLTAGVAALAAALAVGVVAAPAQADAIHHPSFEDGMAQPAFAGDPVIRQNVWVEVPEDTDDDGVHDRVHVEIARPSSTEQGVRLPVIMEASPYFGGFNPVTNHDVDVPLYVPSKPGRDNRGPDGAASMRGADMAAFTGVSGPSIGPSAYENYFLPRGYVFAYAESLGTGESTGCPTIGDHREILGIRSVVDWLNGRAKAFDARTGGSAVAASWTTGKTGMIGVSYNGTLPNGVASTGVEGLETIVPISGISSWYDYYRTDGAVVAPGGFQGEDTDVLFDFVLSRDHPEVCAGVRRTLLREQDRTTGDYSAFWAARDYTRDVDNVHAAVLVSHGLNDWNVKTQQFAQWYEALRAHGVPHMIWLHQHGHGDWPRFIRGDVWLPTLGRWFAHWLYGVDNGIMSEPKATVQREDGSWVTYPDWPDPRTSTVETHFAPGGRTEGALTLDRTRHGQPVVESLVDDASITAEDLAAAPTSPHRLAYRTDPLDQAVRVSGTVESKLRLSFDRPAANVTTLLVDYAPDGSASIVTRGWTDPQNRKSRSATFAIHPGTPYRIDVGMQPDDYVFQPGHRIGVVVTSSDHDYTKRPPAGTELSLDVTKSSVSLPVVGGRDALAAATR